MAQHLPAHAAMTVQGTRSRWAGTWSWIAVDDYLFRVALKQFPWPPSYSCTGAG